MRRTVVIAAALTLAACSRWNNLPEHFTSTADLDIRVSEIATGPNEYDLRARLATFLTFQDDPLQIRAPLENAARMRAGALCGQRKAEVTTIAQQLPVTDVFMHVICR